MRPEAAKGDGTVNYKLALTCQGLCHLRGRHSIMSEEEPEAKDGLGEDIENSVGNDLTINTNFAGSVGNTPDATVH